MGIRDKPTAPASPWQNGFVERLIGSIRRECVDHIIILGEAHRDASGAQKELAALATRGSKDEVPMGAVLEQRWRDELAETGIDPWKAAREFVPSREMNLIVERDFDPPEIEGKGPVAVAASKLFRHQSVIDRKELLHGALVEASLLAIGIDHVIRARVELRTKERAVAQDRDIRVADRIVHHLLQYCITRSNFVR
jgi:hypothetical protein